jgi:uncharacterized surface protein with fasciclin (FAS1) repeats
LVKMRGLSFSRVRWIAFFGWILCAGFIIPLGQAKPAKPPRILDLNDTVMATHILSKFGVLVRGSELGSFLSSRGPFILFAPTDSAFSKLAPGTVAALLQPENKETLQRIVLFHLVNGKRLTAKDLLPLKTLLSCEGNPLPLRVNRAGAQIVAKAKILHADIRCANGLIDEVDTVLVPPGVTLPAPTTALSPDNAMANPAASTNVEDTAPAPATDMGAEDTNAAGTAPPTQ